jgi:dipeptidyl aminopeptidase/acylaminoacyl peptidase
MVRLLAGDHLDDQLAAYEWLKEQPLVAAGRIAVAGNSFGGVEAVLGAERVSYCAAIDGAGGAQSWALAPELHDVMISSARASRAPMFFFQAENDFDLSPSRTLAAAMREVGKTAELRIYPPFGENQGDGHNFAWRGTTIWGEDVLAFLGRHCNG